MSSARSWTREECARVYRRAAVHSAPTPAPLCDANAKTDLVILSNINRAAMLVERRLNMDLQDFSGLSWTSVDFAGLFWTHEAKK